MNQVHWEYDSLVKQNLLMFYRTQGDKRRPLNGIISLRAGADGQMTPFITSRQNSRSPLLTKVLNQ